MKTSEHPEVCQRAGFTLVELLAVIAVIAVVAGLIIGAAGVSGKKADAARATTDIALIQEALDDYRAEYGAYPNGMALDMTLSYFEDLTNYVTEIRFTDPWGAPYIYSCDTNKSAFSYEIKSQGPNPAVPEDDISNRR